MLSLKIYKISKIITSGNINQLSNIFQEEWLFETNKIEMLFKDNMNYNILNNEEKESLKKYIEDRKKEIEKEISSKVKNVQYKSWIYDILVKKDQFFEDIDKMIEEIKNLEYLKKNKNILNEKLEIKLENKDFDIKTYKTFGELHTFTSEYLELFKKRSLKTNNLKPDFEKVFSGEKYDVYKITKEDKDLFQELYGKEGYNTAWCVANKNENHFDQYIQSNSDCYYLFTLKNNKPYALFHSGSGQFKDIHDRALNDFSDDILNFLNVNFDNIKFYRDVNIYKFKVLQKKYPDLNNNQLFVMTNELYSKINEDGNIDFLGHFPAFLLRNFIENGKLLIKFNKVDGKFDCSYNGLVSLEGCPKTVNGDFDCSNNKLTSLEGCPQEVKYFFDCSNNKLTSLKGIPERFKKNLSEIRCRWNEISENELRKTII